MNVSVVPSPMPVHDRASYACGLGKEIMRERERQEILKVYAIIRKPYVFLLPYFFLHFKYSPEFNYLNLGSQQVEIEEHL